MATNNHKRSMSQAERSFWREAFAAAPYWPFDRTPQEIVKLRADFADWARRCAIEALAGAAHE